MATPLETFLAMIGARPPATPASRLREQYPEVYKDQLRQLYPQLYQSPAARTIEAITEPAAPSYRDPRIPKGGTAGPLPKGRTLLDDILPFVAGPGVESAVHIPPGGYRDPRIPSHLFSPDLEPQRGRALSPGGASAPARDESLLGGLHDIGAPGRAVAATMPETPADAGAVSPETAAQIALLTGGALTPAAAPVPAPMAAPPATTPPAPVTPPAAVPPVMATPAAAGAAAPQAPTPAAAVQAPAAPQLSIPEAGPTQTPTTFQEAMRMAAQMLGPAPESTVREPSVWEALLRAGLGMAAAGSRPGANFGGSLAEGALFGLQSYDQQRREAAKEKREQSRDQLQRAQTAAQIAGQQVQADQAARRLSLDERRLVADAKLKQAELDFRARETEARLRDSALSRENQMSIAKLNRESAERIAEAQRGSREALHELQVQANRDAQLTKQIDDTLAKGKVGPGGIKEAYTPEEEAQIRRRIILDSPGTTLNAQLRYQEAIDKFRQIEQAVKGRPDAEKILERANKAFKEEMDAIERDRIRVRK